jgi:hypothetical protein
MMIESLRRAIEVFTGEPVAFDEIDFNTCVGTVFIGKRVSIGGQTIRSTKRITFAFPNIVHENVILFSIFPRTNASAKFDTYRDGLARVCAYEPERFCGRGKHPMQWVGYSSTERWEEPIDPEAVERAAIAAELSVADYLAT